MPRVRTAGLTGVAGTVVRAPRRQASRQLGVAKW